MLKVIDHPLYLCNQKPLSPDDGSLYHYTKFESLLGIFDTMTLRSSPLYKMNDLNEANIDELDWGNEFLKMIDAERYVKKECSVISFTKNYKTGPIFQEGSNHPAMWAHYANDSNGACLVLDKHLLKDINRENLKGIFHRTGLVKYGHRCAPCDSIMKRKYSSSSEFVHINYKELFFKKHLDWKSEKEVRFFVESPQVFLRIKGAIKYIILGERLSKDESSLQKLINLITTPGTQCFHYIITKSFAEMRTSPFGYFTGEAGYLIEKLLCKNSKLSNDYLDWERGL